MAAARALAERYQVVLERDEDAGYFGRTLELPGVMSEGRDVGACVRNVLEAATVAVATMLERRERPPAPADDQRREQQVNIRLSALEKASLESAAQTQGFRSLSDYIRFAALNKVA